VILGIQVQFEVHYSRHPDAELIAKRNKKLLTHLLEKLLYARVDGIVINNELHLMEEMYRA
jgi:hypothetical protein